MEAFGITDYNRFSAHMLPDPYMGNARSHLECLEMGSNLIFEDDVFFEPGARSVFEQAVNELPEDFHVLYLGANIEKPIRRYSEHLYKLEHAYGTNAIYYSEAGRKFVLDNYTWWSNNFEIYDVWLRRQCSLSLKAYIVSPIKTWSHGGFSDVNKNVCNYLPLMKNNAKRFML